MAKMGNKNKKGLSASKISNIKKMKTMKKGKTDAQVTRKHDRRKESKALKKQKEKKEDTEKYKRIIGRELNMEEEITGEEMMDMISKEDMNYLVKSKGSFVEDARLTMGLASDSEEEQVEDPGRSFNKNPMPEWVKTMLPIKTDQGIVPRYMEVKKEESESEEEEKAAASESDDDEDIGKKSTVDIMIERQKKLDEKKKEIGYMAAHAISNSEDNIKIMKNLLNFLDESDPAIALTVKKYAALAVCEVFNNIIPAYRIVDHSQEDRTKLKKETRLLYEYETLLLEFYKNYLVKMESILSEKKIKSGKSTAVKQLVKVLMQCFTELLLRQNHFNYTNNIIQAVAPYGSHACPHVAGVVLKAFRTIFRTDKKGSLSLEIVTHMDRHIRRLNFRVDPEYIRTFMHLNVQDVKNLDILIESKIQSKKKMDRAQKLLRKAIEENKPKQSRKEAKKTRKQRKLEEQMKDIERDKADKSRHKVHAELLQVVFGLYIHVLKRRPNNKLNGTVLEGLARFAHLINIEFFGDLLEVLGQMMVEGSLSYTESMFTIQTVFTILSGQGETLTLDPRRFYTYLYGNMFNMCQDDQATVTQTLKALKLMLVERRRCVSGARALAFAKRLATLCLATPSHSTTIAALATLRSVFLSNPNVSLLLETESEGTCGVFSPEVDEPEHSNAGATALFEYHLLSRHYHSVVQKYTNHMMRGAPLQGEGSLPPVMARKDIEDLLALYDPSQMRFNPPVPHPDQHLPKKQRSYRAATERFAAALNAQVQEVLAEVQDEVHWWDHAGKVKEVKEEEVRKEGAKKRLVNGSTSGSKKQKVMNGSVKVNGVCQNGVGGGDKVLDIAEADFFRGMYINTSLKGVAKRSDDQAVDISNVLLDCGAP